ncbi:MAG: ribosome silencing factor [Chlorobiales bacterium]|nr:ribosome silencing factor [Chlorobiales bacterium]
MYILGISDYYLSSSTNPFIIPLAKKVSSESSSKAGSSSPKKITRKPASSDSSAKKTTTKRVTTKKEKVEKVHIIDNEAELLAKRAAELAITKKATHTVIVDLRGVTDMTDFFVICTADSDRQVKAVADAVMDGLREDGEKPYHVEGLQELSWVLIDYVDVVVHVFVKDAREFYSLEKLWGDAKFTHVEDTAAEKPALKKPARRAAKK